jgi:hypothetical protein
MRACIQQEEQTDRLRFHVVKAGRNVMARLVYVKMSITGGKGVVGGNHRVWTGIDEAERIGWFDEEADLRFDYCFEQISDRYKVIVFRKKSGLRPTVSNGVVRLAFATGNSFEKQKVQTLPAIAITPNDIVEIHCPGGFFQLKNRKLKPQVRYRAPDYVTEALTEARQTPSYRTALATIARIYSDDEAPQVRSLVVEKDRGRAEAVPRVFDAIKDLTSADVEKVFAAVARLLE